MKSADTLTSVSLQEWQGALPMLLSLVVIKIDTPSKMIARKGGEKTLMSLVKLFTFIRRIYPFNIQTGTVFPKVIIIINNYNTVLSN